MRKVWIVLGLMAAVIAVVAISFIALNWERPLGPALPEGGELASSNTLEATRTWEAMPTPVAMTTAASAPTEDPAAATQTYAALQDLSKPTRTPSPAPTPFCGGPEKLVVLAIGTDSRPDNYLYGLGDAIRIVRADFVAKKLSVLSIPRDLWVEIPKLQAHGITHGKLSQAFSWGTEGMGYYQSDAGGAGLLALTLEHNFGVQFDRYFTVNMQTFKRMIGSIGGINIYVATTLDGRTDFRQPKQAKYGYFEQGYHVLDGGEALMYARIRKMDNDFWRQKRQTQLLKEIRKRVLSPDIIDAVPDLIEAFRGRVLTDLSPEEITQLSCLVMSLDASDISYSMLEQDLLTSFTTQSGQAALRGDPDQIGNLLQNFIAGRAPR
jgi:LCP family protein required for cell wall assembly